MAKSNVSQTAPVNAAPIAIVSQPAAPAPAAQAHTTPMTVAQALTDLSPITPTKPASGFITRMKVGTPYVKKDGTMGKLTDKSKPCLGLPDSRQIIWAHANFEPIEYSIFQAFAKSQKLDIAELAARIVMQWYEVNAVELEKFADGFVKAEMTVEDMVKKAQRAKREYERLMRGIEMLTADDDADEDDEAASGNTADAEGAAPADEGDDFPTDDEITAASKG